MAMNTLASDDNDDHDCDPELLARAIDIFRTENQRSISLLQRRLRLGYTLASKLMDQIAEHDLDGQ
jgi:DNA segregation ATPase FtsK/SpoIIIE-like protein